MPPVNTTSLRAETHCLNDVCVTRADNKETKDGVWALFLIGLLFFTPLVVGAVTAFVVWLKEQDGISFEIWEDRWRDKWKATRKTTQSSLITGTNCRFPRDTEIMEVIEPPERSELTQAAELSEKDFTDNSLSEQTPIDERS